VRQWPPPRKSQYRSRSSGSGSGSGCASTSSGVTSLFRIEHDDGQALSTLVSELLEECGDKGYLLRYDSKAALMSGEARRDWVPPDSRLIEP
jgi:hypothetical protein